MNAPGSVTSSAARLSAALQRFRSAMGGVFARLTPRQRQYVVLASILTGGVGLLWLIFSLTATTPIANDPQASNRAQPSSVTNIGVMSPGQQVNPVDQWVGTAGRKLAQYESERDEQTRLNKDRQAFEARTMQRFAEIEQRLTSAAQAASMTTAPTAPAPQAPATATTSSAQVGMPPTSVPPPPLPLPPSPARTYPTGSALPPGEPSTAPPDPAPVAPVLTRISLVDRSSKPQAVAAAQTDVQTPAVAEARTVSTFLPVSFTRGTLLGGLDAPTGGQSQSNPQPVLIRLSDNSVLPNQFRGEYRDCFVIAAGYGDISSERAYLRTENLSCVRPDGATLEVRIQGTVYGEDGKVGMRGRLVTKQGQMLANALLAGVVSGIGQGLTTSSTTYSTSALGTIANSGGNSSEAYRAGLGSGVGKALDRLAQYYIKLAENTFPVIEVDAGREIDVVITKGVRIDVPMDAGASASIQRTTQALIPEDRYGRASHDDND